MITILKTLTGEKNRKEDKKKRPNEVLNKKIRLKRQQYQLLLISLYLLNFYKNFGVSHAKPSVWFFLLVCGVYGGPSGFLKRPSFSPVTSSIKFLE